MKTHTLSAVVNGEDVARKVDAQERVQVRDNGTLLSFKVADLHRLEALANAEGESTIYIHEQRGARYLNLNRGASVKLGNEGAWWPLSELSKFELVELPPKAQPPPPDEVSTEVRQLSGAAISIGWDLLRNDELPIGNHWRAYLSGSYKVTLRNGVVESVEREETP